MEGFLISGIVLGISCVLVSFFAKDNQKLNADEKEKLIQEMKKDILNKDPFEELVTTSREDLEKKLDELISERIMDSKDRLNETTNQKMLALSEMFDSLESKAKHNHQEVVFLYDMLNQKTEEIKVLSSTIDGMRKSLAEEEKKLIRTFRFIQKKMVTKVGNEARANKDKSQNQNSGSHFWDDRREEEKGDTSKKTEGKQKDYTDLNEKILSMKEAGHSVLDISKELRMGQGEVSLILGLYGKDEREE